MTGEFIQTLAQVAPTIVQASSGDGGPLWLLLAGPAGAGGTYWAFWRYYRNTDKSHEFERDTIIAAQPVQGAEQKVDHIAKTRDSSVEGKNSESHRSRVHRID